MFKNLSFLFLFLQLISCSKFTQNKSDSVEMVPNQNTYFHGSITRIKDLPDSLQPKKYLLSEMPKAPIVPIRLEQKLSQKVPANGGKNSKISGITWLDALNDEEGNLVLDSQANRFVHGRGGISKFVNYKSEDGLALDGIACSMIDKEGNLWFGTNGGGVSKFDGKTFTNYNTDHGLGDNTVLDIIEDHIGNMWFATFGGGITQFDGYSFHRYKVAQGLSSNFVWSLGEDSEGNIWVGTQKEGVCKLSAKRLTQDCFNHTCAHQLTNIEDVEIHNKEIASLFVNYTKRHGLLSNTIFAITIDHNNDIWLGTNGGGISKYMDRKSNHPCHDNKCKHVLEVQQELKKHDEEIYKTFQSFNSENGLSNNIVYCLEVDRNGYLWIGTKGGGVNRFDGNKFVNYNNSMGLASNVVISICEDYQGNMWFGTDGGGVSKYANDKFNSLTTKQGLPNNYIFSITCDLAGHLWFGTHGNGICKYEGESLISFNEDQGLITSLVSAISEDSAGNLWIGTFGDGILMYNGQTISNITEKQGLADDYIRDIYNAGDGNMWMGTFKSGVICYNGNGFTNYSKNQGLPGSSVVSLMKDRDGNVWLGSLNGGVSKFDGKSFTTYNVNQGFTNNAIYDIVEDNQGLIWFATSGGISCFDGSSFLNFSKKDGLVHDMVICITKDIKGNLWFGTSGGGVSRLSKEMVIQIKEYLKGAKVQIKRTSIFDNFSVRDGLANNTVYDIAQKSTGEVFIGTNMGITMIPAHLYELPFSKIGGRVEYFNTSTGYPIKDINTKAMFIDKYDVLWAGSGSDETPLFRLDINATKHSKKAPKLVIKDIQINEEKIVWRALKEGDLKSNQFDAYDSNTTSALIASEVSYFGSSLDEKQRLKIRQQFKGIQFDTLSKFYSIPSKLVLPYQFNHVTFEIAAIETANPDLVQYQYILEGYDRNWSPVNNRNNVTFGNIREGKYTFKVKARVGNEKWSPLLIYKFSVLPPWYRTWWAYAIYFTLFLFAFDYYRHWRERHLRRQKEQLELVVESRTEELLTKNQLVEKQKEELVQKNKTVEIQKAEVEKERQRSDELLFNILPEEVADELKAKGSAEAKYFDSVTVMFTDFQNFTQLSNQMNASELVQELHTCFMAFDLIIEKYGIEKIKTIGDSYMCAGGIPVANETHPINTVKAGLEIQAFIKKRIKERIDLGLEPFHIRIGIHTGAVVAGIVGIKKFAYDIWGDTVNTASRMESNGEVGKVNISETTYRLVKDQFECTYRGKIEAKGKGELDMYFVRLPS